MNEHIKKLLDRALDQAVPETWTQLSHEQMTRLSSVFAELIVRECCQALNPMLRDMISRGQGVDLIKLHFGIEERKGWVCSRCGVDRIQDVCPKGNTAALTGECPMTGKALLGVER